MRPSVELVSRPHRHIGSQARATQSLACEVAVAPFRLIGVDEAPEDFGQRRVVLDRHDAHLWLATFGTDCSRFVGWDSSRTPRRARSTAVALSLVTTWRSTAGSVGIDRTRSGASSTMVRRLTTNQLRGGKIQRA